MVVADADSGFLRRFAARNDRAVEESEEV